MKKKTKTKRLNEDAVQRKRYKRGKRIEAYTFGETQSKKKNRIWDW